jgi:Skp family chaperone for outer membrane proteins
MDRQNTSGGGQEVPEGAQEWLSMLQGLAEQIQKQQQNSQQMVQDMMNTYVQLLNIPGYYMSEQAQQQQVLQQTVQQWMRQAQEQRQTFQQQAQEQQQAFQQMFQESANTFMQLFNIPASYAQEGLRAAQQDSAGTPGGGLPRETPSKQYRR